jgi:hypothetical protein
LATAATPARLYIARSRVYKSVQKYNAPLTEHAGIRTPFRLVNTMREPLQPVL